MASEIRIEFIGEGFGEILRSDGTRSLVQETADQICDRANANNSRGGKGFTKSVEQSARYKNRRWIGWVTTADKKAIEAETEDGALTRAVL